MLVMCDIDGVLCDPCDLVKQYLSGPQKDWEGYFTHTSTLQPIQGMVDMVKGLMNSDNVVMFETGRPERIRVPTVEWLRNHLDGTPFLPHYVFMRRDGDHKPGWRVKLDICRHYHPDLVIDDEPETVSQLSHRGFLVLQVHGHRVSEANDHVPT